MTEAELIKDILFRCPDLTYRQAVRYLQATKDAIRSALLRGEDVKIAGLGTWNTRLRNASVKQIPGKGARHIAPAPVVLWHPSRTFKAEIEQADPTPFKDK